MRTGPDSAFATLDPQASTDLDQAFSIERSGSDLMLQYAIADVAWFVSPGEALDLEAWSRGTTIYMPDGKAGLYPSRLSEARPVFCRASSALRSCSRSGSILMESHRWTERRGR